MKAIRLKLRQSSANYKKEGADLNKMTYPLPPFSTVIGALHTACGYTEYHPMDLSIQGRYGSMVRKPYTDHCFLNNLMDDRGILVKMRNGSMLSTAYEVVAESKKSQGNSFRNGVTILVHDEALIKEYRDLKDQNDRLQERRKTEVEPELDRIKKEKAAIKAQLRKEERNSDRWKELKSQEKALTEADKTCKQAYKDEVEATYTRPISQFRTLVKSLKYYELLMDVELIIHVHADEETMKDILDNIGNLRAIGRSEDTVEVLEAREVELVQGEVDEDLESEYSAYIDAALMGNNRKKAARVFRLTESKSSRTSLAGTRYSLPKDYIVQDNKRIFRRKPVIYVARYSIVEADKNLWIDGDGADGNEPFIVNLI